MKSHETRSRIEKVKRKARVAVPVLAAALAIAACNDEKSTDAESKFLACPQYHTDEALPLKDAEKSHERLQEGIRIFEEQYDLEHGDKKNLWDISGAELGALSSIYLRENPDDTRIVTIDSETKLDDMSETICEVNDKLYFSPGAIDAKGDLYEAGVEVEPEYELPKYYK